MFIKRGTMNITVIAWKYARSGPEITCDFIKTKTDRAILRAVIAEIDRQEGERS